MWIGGLKKRGIQFNKFKELLDKAGDLQFIKKQKITLYFIR